MAHTLNGRHALICGASRGIGQATALAMARRGARLTLLARSAGRLAEVARESTDAGAPAAHVLVADLDAPQAARDRVLAHLKAHGPIHVLVHNTGGPPSGALLSAPADALQHAFRRHVLSAHLLVQALLPGMREAGYGRILTVLSTSVREPLDGLGVSNTIRAAMASWAKSLSRELPPGITINNVLPGFTDTERLATLAQATSERTGRPVEEVRKGWLTQVPEGRIGEPCEIAEALAFLASPAAAYIRGISLPVDGGRSRSI